MYLHRYNRNYQLNMKKKRIYLQMHPLLSKVKIPKSNRFDSNVVIVVSILHKISQLLYYLMLQTKICLYIFFIIHWLNDCLKKYYIILLKFNLPLISIMIPEINEINILICNIRIKIN